MYETQRTDWRPSGNPLHLESDAADNHIRINPEIRILISDHVWLMFRRNDWRWRRYAVSERIFITHFPAKVMFYRDFEVRKVRGQGQRVRGYTVKFKVEWPCHSRFFWPSFLYFVLIWSKISRHNLSTVVDQSWKFHQDSLTVFQKSYYHGSTQRNKQMPQKKISPAVAGAR